MFTRPQLKSTTLKLLLALGLAWSVLQAALIVAIHLFQPSTASAFLWAAIPVLPLCLMIVVIARLHRSDPQSHPRSHIYGIALYASALLVYSLLFVWLETACFENKSGATWGLAVQPLIFPGVLFVIALLQPLHKINADPKTSLRIKLAAPLLRWIFRMVAVGAGYGIARLISSLLFENYEVTGILAFAVALLPALPVFGLIWVHHRFMQEEQDEFQRRQIQLSTLWSLFGTFLIASALGPLEEHSLIFHRHPGWFQISSVFALFLWLQSYLGFLFTFIPLTRISRQQEKQTP